MQDDYITRNQGRGEIKTNKANKYKLNKKNIREKAEISCR